MTETVYEGTLNQALSSGYINPGDGLLLKNGTFTDDFIATLLNVTIRPYLKERAIFNGKVTTDGRAITFRNLEFSYLDWTSRESSQTGSAPSDIPDKIVAINTPGCKFINCIFHDLPTLGLWVPATSAEFYGCIIFHNGWSAPDRGHGHGLYLQNETLTKTVKDCIVFNNFGWGLHAYSSVGSRLKNFVFEGNVCFGSGSLFGDTYPNFLLGADSGQADVSSFVANMSYGADGLQFYGDGAINVTLADNYMPDGKTGTYSAISESSNYWGAAIGNQVFVRPNSYQSDRANVTIYNQAEADTVSVDLSAVIGLQVGDSVSVRNVQNYFVDIQTLTLDMNKKITVNMQAANRTVSTPVQWTLPATTFPKFGCFVLEKQ